jgi:hypothetical protein
LDAILWLRNVRMLDSIHHIKFDYWNRHLLIIILYIIYGYVISHQPKKIVHNKQYDRMICRQEATCDMRFINDNSQVMLYIYQASK